MILPDYPIQSKENDRLKRALLAQKVADMILGFKGKESFVIGIEGEWGAGKTSFINMVLEALGANTFHFVFNPWNFSDELKLLEDFFSSYSLLLKEKISLEEEKEKTLLNQIDSYANALKPSLNINFKPEIGLLGNLFNIKFGEVNKALFGTNNLEKARDEINKTIKSFDKKIVVVIDDIDRLDIDETKSIFKLVKLTANFPNTIFLLAYDRKPVEVRLTRDGFDGGEYLKKIVQASFALPKSEPQDLWQILFEDLDTTIKAIYGEVDFDKKGWGNLFHSGFKNLFLTIRDVKRFVSSLRLDWSIVSKDDITPVDFIGIEAIRVFSPQLYSAMSANKHLLTATDSLYSGLSATDDKAAREATYKELLELAPEKIRKSTDEICKRLFPQLDFKTTYSPDFQQTWRKEKRICSEEKFDFYLSLSIPTGAVSEKELEAIFKTTDNKENFLKNLKTFYEDNRLRKVLERLMDYIDKLNSNSVKNFILALWQLVDETEDERHGVWDLEGVDTLVGRLSYHSIKQKVESGKRGDFIAQLVNEGVALYPAVDFASMLVHEYEENNNKPNKEMLLGKEEAEKAKKAFAEKINANKNDLLINKHLVSLLFRWKESGGEHEVNKFIKEVLQSKSHTATFLSAFVSDTFTHAMGDYVSTKRRDLNKKPIEDLYNIEEIEKVVNSITDEELESFNAQQKEAIELFKNSGSQ